MPKAIPIISAFHNLSAGDLADEHGQLCAQTTARTGALRLAA